MNDNKLYTLNELAKAKIDVPQKNRELWYSLEELYEALDRTMVYAKLKDYAREGKLGKRLNLYPRTWFLRADLPIIRDNVTKIFIDEAENAK